MKFYDVSKLLYLEIDAFSIGPGAGLLQVRDSINCRQDKVLGNTALHPIAFESKSLSSMEQQYSNIE